MARQACEAYGFKLSDQIEEHFKYKTTHNDGVFRVYSDEAKDLYGVDRLIAEKRKDWISLKKWQRHMAMK